MYIQGDHSPDILKFPDISLTTCGTRAHVKCYSYHACSTSFNVNDQTIKFTIIYISIIMVMKDEITMYICSYASNTNT